ncbi:MAG TPA: toxic anion resistance protein, partial [Lachnospiraceae bacterium]|nr:toxic anion resistance protein [Lachnospiraceae bacterium]
MQDEFETLTKTAAPTLTFDIPEEKEPPAEAKPEPPAQPEPVDDSVLSDEEKRMVDQFSEKIDIRNTTAVLQYGAGTQKKMADFSEKALDKVKTKDLGE